MYQDAVVDVDVAVAVDASLGEVSWVHERQPSMASYNWEVSFHSSRVKQQQLPRACRS